MNLERILEQFREYLCLNFKGIESILTDDQIEDWLQANWEVMVEFRLRDAGITKGLIDVYGNGADCNESSSRVSLHDLHPTSAIHIAPGCIFHSFGTLKDGFFDQGAPFDYVKGEYPNTNDLVLPLEQAKFSIGQTYDELAGKTAPVFQNPII